AALRPARGAGAKAARPVRRADPRAPVARHALRRADLRDPGPARRGGARVARPDDRDRGPLPHAARGALRLQRCRPGGRHRQRARRGRRRAAGAAGPDRRGLRAWDRGSCPPPRLARRLDRGARLPDGRAPRRPRGQGPGRLRVGDDDRARARGRARDDHAPRLARHPHRLIRALRRNVLALGADYGFFMVGLSFASHSTILPAFAAYLDAPNVAAGAVGFAGSFLTSHVLETVPAPRSYGICFLYASACMALSYIALALVREPAASTAATPVALRTYLARVPALLSRDANLRRFLLARAFA